MKTAFNSRIAFEGDSESTCSVSHQGFSYSFLSSNKSRIQDSFFANSLVITLEIPPTRDIDRKLIQESRNRESSAVSVDDSTFDEFERAMVEFNHYRGYY